MPAEDNNNNENENNNQLFVDESKKEVVVVPRLSNGKIGVKVSPNLFPTGKDASQIENGIFRETYRPYTIFGKTTHP